MTEVSNGMDYLITVINKLQDAYAQVGVATDLNLPQIAVVGSQSAGKSSVLENFVGCDFLPRGTGICTRRPLILQLINSHERYANFLHLQNKKIYDFSEVRREIERETDRIASDKCISDIPITLKIYSPHVLNLTLIDLPGLTKVPVGKQPQDIEFQIRKMILSFISNPNFLILAVTPATTDLATSDALQLAQEVDPERIRTIGVITKIDLLESGMNCLEVLQNKVYPLKRGYVGVINRSQKDIQTNKDIRDALNSEKQYFLKNTAYRILADKIGTPYLQKVLNEQLSNHIKDSMPKLQNKLEMQMIELEKEKSEIIDETEENFGASSIFLHMNNFAKYFRQNLKGGNYSSYVNTSELTEGAKINITFFMKFPYEFAKLDVEIERKLTKMISFAILNTNAVRIGLFTPDKAFEKVVKKCISFYKDTCLELMNKVCVQVNELIKYTCKSLSRFPKLESHTNSLLNTFLGEKKQACEKEILEYFEIESAYLNTNHEDFVGFENINSSNFSNKAVSKKNVSNQVIRKGWLSINQSIIRSKVYWFVLSTENFAWYSKTDMREMRYNFPLDNLRIKDSDSGFISKKPSFILFKTDGENVFKDEDKLELLCESEEEREEWKTAFLKAGVYPITNIKIEEEEKFEEVSDPRHDRQVEILKQLVKSYLDIIKKSLKDKLPKIIMYCIVNQLEQYVVTEIPAFFVTINQSSDLLKESEESVTKRNDFMLRYNTTKEALQIISNLSFGSLPSTNKPNKKPNIPQKNITIPQVRITNPPIIPSRPGRI